MDDQDMKRDLNHWPFKVQEKSGKPAITVDYQDQEFFTKPHLSHFNLAMAT
jgi:heat shock protein 5